mgnify:CR=1 FL=1
MNPFDIARKTRENILKVIDGLSVEQMNLIPKGYTNNMVWHLGHLLATQQLIVYKLSGTEVLVTDNIIDEFRKGTKPENEYTEEDILELKEMLIQVINHSEEDFEAGIFGDFSEYPTSYGLVLNSLEEAIMFNNIHEAVHLGMIMSMKKLV